VTTAVLDDFLVRYAPGPRVTLSPALVSSRAALARFTETLRPIPDAALPGLWSSWGPDGEVRYGFYRILESLETAELGASAAVRRATGRFGMARSASGDLTALTTAARWDLHGRLAVIDDGMLDTDPGGGEWNLRQTMAHVVSGQRGYGWYTAYWLAQAAPDANDLPPRVPDEIASQVPDEELEGRGSLAEIRARFDSTVDGSTEVLGRLDEEALALGSRWMGNAVTIGFRIGRWSSHIREHTVQVDKTLAIIGWTPREVDRLIGLIHAAYGRLEAAVYAVPTDLLESADEDGRTPAAIVEDALASAEGVAAEVADIALAGVAGAPS
jgi:hypothetical protein